MLNWDMLKPPGQPMADHGWGRLARQKQKRNLIEPAISRLSICGDATRISGAFLLVLILGFS
ncbi:hypothetical protein C3733_20150 [Bacillus amyloliquefaciens]|nr:hypothetical protein C3733_20150 [Bacillus amyloliquefaciens]